MSKHTPGPWTLTIDPTEVSGVNVRIEIHSQDGRCVTSGQSQEHLHDDYGVGILEPECRANGRLIAAAPELLDAALQVIAWYEAENDHSKADFYQRMQMCRDSESALRAAIAKATGEPA